MKLKIFKYKNEKLTEHYSEEFVATRYKQL